MHLHESRACVCVCVRVVNATCCTLFGGSAVLDSQSLTDQRKLSTLKLAQACAGSMTAYGAFFFEA